MLCTSDLFFEVFNSAILAALAALAIPFVKYGTLMLRIAFAATLLFLQHLAVLILYGLIFSRGISPASLVEVLWTVRGFGMVAPMLIWWLVSRAIRE